MEYREIQHPIRPLLDRSNRVLREMVRSRLATIRDLRRHTPIDKGKKIRSTFLFLLARLVGLRERELHRVGAAIEMFHLSSLIHDDIIDNSQSRRGAKTPNQHFGNCLSVLWGDYLFMHSLGLIRGKNQELVLEILIRTSMQMVEGQIQEYANSFNYQIKQNTYMEIIRKKTSSLFAGIAELVARLHGARSQRVSELFRFGDDFGRMFQIGDDLLDIFPGATGKDSFRDFHEGKVTLPFILLIRDSPVELTSRLTKISPEELLQWFQRQHIREKTQAVIDRYYRDCQEFLSSFPNSLYRKSLIGLLDFVRQRDF